jgi:hypothetical protein
LVGFPKIADATSAIRACELDARKDTENLLVSGNSRHKSARRVVNTHWRELEDVRSEAANYRRLLLANDA